MYSFTNMYDQTTNLQGDIRLLTKRRDDMQREMERMDVSRSEQSRQRRIEIDQLTRQRNELTEQVEAKKQLLETLTQNYEQAKTDLETYKDHELKQANKRLEEIRTLAATIEDNAAAKDLAAGEKKRAVDNYERQLTQWSQLLSDEWEKLKGAREAFEDVRNEWYRTAAQREEDLRQSGVKLATLKEEIQQLEVKRGQLEQDIADRQIRQGLKEQDYNQRVLALEIREKAQDNLKTSLAKQKKDQEEENIRIRDRWGQIERGIAEYRAKGVVI